ncbi:MAG: MBOAT family protein, partial [Flavobacteriales bacterium]|nr:MBOAT family protein [Flavobacteriales bacterium]
TWFRDYLYIPLGGSRLSAGRTYLNLFIVFLLPGLWHGASWNFVVWGLVHGLFLVIERAGLGRLLDRAPRLVGHLYTLVVVLMAWVFFRITDLTEAWHTILAMVGANPGDAALNPPALFVTHSTLVALAIGVLGALNVHALVGRWTGLRRTEPHLPGGVRGALEVAGLLLLFVGVAMAVASTTYSPFIYFRF